MIECQQGSFQLFGGQKKLENVLGSQGDFMGDFFVAAGGEGKKVTLGIQAESILTLSGERSRESA